MQLYPHNYAEIIAAIVCTIYLLYKSSVTNRWFTPFLWITVSMELIAKQLSQQLEVKNLIYNIFNIIEFVFYLSYLSTIINNKKDARILKILAAIIAIAGIVNLLFGQQEKRYNHYTTMLGSAFVIFACLLTYFSLLSNNTYYKLPSNFLLITSGLLLFYAGNFFVYSFYSSLSKNNPSLLVSIYRIVNGYLNVFMYSCFALAFIMEILSKNLKPLAQG